MRTTDEKFQPSAEEELTPKSGPGAFYLSAPFLLCMGIVGVMPWIAG